MNIRMAEIGEPIRRIRRERKTEPMVTPAPKTEPVKEPVKEPSPNH